MHNYNFKTKSDRAKYFILKSIKLVVNITNSRIKSMVTEWKAKHKQKKNPAVPDSTPTQLHILLFRRQ